MLQFEQPPIIDGSRSITMTNVDVAIPRILYLTNNPNLGSTTRVLQDWLRIQRDRGSNPAVVVREPGPLADWLRSEDFSFLIDSMPWPSKWHPVSALWHAVRVGRWARERGVQVIHCNEHDIYPFAVLLRSLFAFRIVCSTQFAISREFGEWAFAAKLPFFVRILTSIIRQRLPKDGPEWQTRRPDHLIWTSEAQRLYSAPSVAGLVAESRQSVVPLGISPDAFRPDLRLRERQRREYGLREEQVAIGCACALRPVKRVHDFLTVIEKLSVNRPNVVGLLAGEAPIGDEDYRDYLLRRMWPLIESNKLIWVGNLVDVRPFLQSVDVFVSSSEFETFGMSVCEAMACGKPVAGYAANSVKEVVSDGGIIVDTGDLTALTNAVAKLIDQPAIRSELGNAARSRVQEHYDPKVSLMQLDVIYQSMMRAL